MLQALQTKQYGLVLNTVPLNVKDVLDCPPVQDLVNSGVKINDLEACLAVEIARISNMLTVGGNLRQGQSVEIARTMISEFPGESLQDFCLCLRKGIKGHYGDVFRFDILVIHEWFKKYLLEKYDAVEERLMREKESGYDAYKKPLALSFNRAYDYPAKYAPLKDPAARLALWKHQWNEMSTMQARKPAPLSDKDVTLEGREKPKKNWYPSTPLSVIEQKDLHIQYLRDNYDPYTGKQKEGWISEDEWLKKQKQ